MSTATKPVTGVVVEKVDFAVPTHYTIGKRFPTWEEAVSHARATISGIEYPGQKVNPDALYYHPKRYVQEGDVLVNYSRAFVHMRVVEPVQEREGSRVKSGSDAVVMSWEVFQDGSVEAI